MSEIVARIEAFLKEHGIKNSQAEAAMGLANGTLVSAFRRRSSIKTKNLELFLKTFPEADPLWICSGLKKHLPDGMVMEAGEVYPPHPNRFVDGQRIPLFNIDATTGLAGLLGGQGATKPVGYISIPNLPKCDGAVFLSGDSMSPLLKTGDIVMYKETHNIKEGLIWGEIYLISIDVEGEEYVSVKYVQKSALGDAFVKLVSQNDLHNPMDVAVERIKALALVKASVRINSMP